MSVGLIYASDGTSIKPVKCLTDGTIVTSSGATTSIEWLWSRSLATATSGNAKAAAGDVYAIRCVNMNLNLRWFQLFNLAAAPAATAVPLMSLPVFGGNGFLILGESDFSPAGMNFTTGISWGFSTTATTYTAGAAADVIVEIGYT